MSPRRVVITGLGPVTPLGTGVDAFWKALLERRSAVRRLRAFDPGRFESQIGAEIDGLSVGDCVPKSYRKASKIMARDIVLAVAAAYHALRDAGLRTKCFAERNEAEGAFVMDHTRLGANIGAGLICADLPELAEALYSASEDGRFSFARWGTEGMNNLTPLWLLKFLPNMLACHVTIVHDAQGPSNTITCGEASSHLAIGEAFRTISRGSADACICGGAESKDNPMALLRQQLAKRLSRRNDTPETACRPLAADRDGTVISEGGGLVVLEELEHAKRRGARIYAELVGFGAAHDAYVAAQPTKPHPDGRGTAVAMKKALADARLAPGQIDLVVSCATGLVEHDRSEAAGIRAVFPGSAGVSPAPSTGQRPVPQSAEKPVPRGSVGVSPAPSTGQRPVPQSVGVPVMNIRAGLGNNGAGSGAIDFIAATLALYHGTVPPALNSEPPDPACGLAVLTSGPKDLRCERVVSPAYALGGGQNAALVIQRYR